jgi:fructose-1,6-bisphosphatase/inositol monophosphatase family enzyme
LNPWDTAAGVLIVQGSRRNGTNMTGGPFQIDSRETLAS